MAGTKPPLRLSLSLLDRAERKGDDPADASSCNNPVAARERDAILRNNARNGTEIGLRVLARLKNVGCARASAPLMPRFSECRNRMY